MTADLNFDIAGKRIVLVGSTGVLGRAHAAALAKGGARLTLVDLKGSDVMSLASSFGDDCQGIEANVTDEAAVRNAFNAAARRWNGLDGAVSNAALTGERLMAEGDAFAAFEDYPLDVWRRVIDVNLTGSFLVAREAGRLMKASGGNASMVLVSSVYGLIAPDHRLYDGQPFKSFAGYSASKAGIVGLTKWLATWWARDGIRVNCLAPGGVFNDHDPKFAADYGARVPLGRMANRDEVSACLMFLLSDASSYITGQVLTVDGGMSAW